MKIKEYSFKWSYTRVSFTHLEVRTMLINKTGITALSSNNEHDRTWSNTIYIQSIQTLEHSYEFPGALGQRPTVAQDLGLNDVLMYLQQQQESQKLDSWNTPDVLEPKCTKQMQMRKCKYFTFISWRIRVPVCDEWAKLTEGMNSRPTQKKLKAEILTFDHSNRSPVSLRTNLEGQTRACRGKGNKKC